jgi:cellulose synthase/poly-beta-1,6-N-acetylglucosamine synthase-like glycosyltransferase
MSFIALVLVFLTFSISVFNFITIRKPENDDLVSESVTVIVPMRNESENVAECISALSSQSSVDNLKFILVNDSSTDDTLALIRQAIAGDSRFTVIDSPELRTGWLGKVSALEAKSLGPRYQSTERSEARFRLSLSSASCRYIFREVDSAASALVLDEHRCASPC